MSRKNASLMPIVLLLAGPLFAGCFFTSPPRDESIETESAHGTLDNYRAGHAELNKAISALGGRQALTAFQDLSFDYDGMVLARGQSKSSQADYFEREVSGRFVYDSGGRVRHDQQTAFLGGRGFAFTRVNDGNEGWTWRKDVSELSNLTAFDIGFLQNVPQQHAPWTIPHSLVLAAMANPTSIRLESSGRGGYSDGVGDSFDGETRISFSTSTGVARTLVLDSATGLPDRIQFLASDPLIGDVQREIRYSDYRNVGDLLIPHGLTFVSAGEELERWTLSDVSVNISPDEAVFAKPEGEPISPTPSFRPQRVAEGVYAVRLFSGMSFSYNTMLVVSESEVTVVEAPLTDFFYRVIKGIADQIAPGKPIRNVVSTHTHFDHMMGLKAYLAAGANVYTASDNAAQIEVLAMAEHTIQPNPLRGTNVDKLPIHIVQGQTRMVTASREIQLIDVGPNPHVDQMLVAYIPDVSVMFVADMFTSFESGSFDPPPPSLISFAEKLAELGIEPRIFVPAHGPVVSWSDFERAVGGSESIGAVAE